MKIGILSLGLIGGSILKKLSQYHKDITITAVTGNEKTAAAAASYTNCVSTNISNLKDCEIVFVCAPMNKTPEILQKLESIVPKDTIVADVCSLKSFVTEKKYSFKFIGTHPMAGTENSGFEASFPELFEGAKWIITPDEATDEKDIEKLTKLIALTGAEIIKMKAEEHDRAAALISHMPMLVSQAIMKTALKSPAALKMASSGFRDMTRLSLSNTQMAEDMIKLNSKNISDCAVELVESIKSLLDDSYKEQIEVIKDFRQKMYTTDGKNAL